MSTLVFNGKELTLSDAQNDPLVRAVVISLFSWRRAADDDVVDGFDRQGFWGDQFNAETVGRKTGSRLWLLLRSKVTEETMRQAKEYCDEALNWLLEDGIAKYVEAIVERNEQDRVDVVVMITKPDNNEISIRFQDVWEKV